MEFKQEITAPVIKINFDAMKSALETEVLNYKGLVVTEDNYQFCKDKKKELSGFKNQIEDFRKAVKKEIMKPYESVEVQCKELVAIIDVVRSPIAEGVDVFDNARKEEKRKKALEIIEELVEVSELRPSFAERIPFLPEYANLTATPKDVRASVESAILTLKVEQMREDELVGIIREAVANKNIPLKTKMEVYTYTRLMDKGLPVSDILTMIDGDAKRIYDAENYVEPEPQGTNTPEVAESSSHTNSVPHSHISEPEDMYWQWYKVVGTPAQLKTVSEFLRSNGIQYELGEQGEI